MTEHATIRDNRMHEAVNGLSEWQAKNFINALLETATENGFASLRRHEILALLAEMRNIK